MRSLGVLILLCFSANVALQAQVSGAGVLPAVNLNVKVNDLYRLNFRVESRQALATGGGEFPSEFDYRYLLTDYSAMVSRKIGLNNTLAGGYLVRVEDGAVEHRVIQQLTLLQRVAAFRLAHRFSTDQTFGEAQPTFRLRYRAAVEFPLNGQSVDARESYIKLNHEYLLEWQGGASRVEMRIVPFYGYAIDKQNKIEVGIDYRRANLGAPLQRATYWLSIGWFKQFG
jgi:hypothetical protein